MDLSGQLWKSDKNDKAESVLSWLKVCSFPIQTSVARQQPITGFHKLAACSCTRQMQHGKYLSPINKLANKYQDEAELIFRRNYVHGDSSDYGQINMRGRLLCGQLLKQIP